MKQTFPRYGSFADYPEFTELGEPAHNEYLDAFEKKTCQEMFGSAIKINNFFPIYIAKHQFFHEPFQVDRRIWGVIYFEDIKIGGSCSFGGLSPYRCR
jgi:hypothetical protein